MQTSTYNELLAGLDQAVVVCDAQGMVTALHGTAAELLPTIDVGDSLASADIPEIRAAIASGSRQFTARYSGRRLHGTVRPLDDGAWACYLRDTTEEAVRAETLQAEQVRSEFLSEATRRLAASLHLERVQRLTVLLAVPRWADVCVYLSKGQHGTVEWQRHDAWCAAGATVSGRLPQPRDPRLGWLTDALNPATDLFAVADDTAGLEDTDILPEPLRQAKHPLLVLPVTAHGQSLGALVFVRDNTRADFDDTARQVLHEYANRAGTAIGVATLYRDQAQTATSLRRGLLPAPLPQVPGIEFGRAYRAAREVDRIGGDYYEVHVTSADSVDFLLGDVCGKGADAAVLASLVRHSISALRLVEDNPLRLLDLLNRVVSGVDSERFTTLLLGRVHREAGQLRVEIAGGGHPVPFVLRADGSVTSVGIGGMLVGAIDNAEFATATFTLRPGDLLLLYSDGITEARRSTGEMFGEQRLRSLLATCAGSSAPDTAARIENEVTEWLGVNRHDDLTVLTLRAAPE